MSSSSSSTSIKTEPHSTETSSSTSATETLSLKSDNRRTQIKVEQRDYSSSEDSPPPGERWTGKKSSATSSSSSSSQPSHFKPEISPSLISSCGKLELEYLGLDHGSSAASSAVGEVSERNIKGGRYDVTLPGWRKGQDFVQPTNIPIRILTDFSVFRKDDQTLARLEKLPQINDGYGCYVGEERTPFIRQDPKTKGKEVVMSEGAKTLIKEQDVQETKDIEENSKQIVLINEAMKTIQKASDFVVFGTVTETLPEQLRPRPESRPLSRWQRSSAPSVRPKRRNGLRGIKMQKNSVQFTEEERESARKTALQMSKNKKTPYTDKGITVLSAGVIHTVSANFNSSTTIFPVGYRSMKTHPDIDNVQGAKVKYVSEIVLDPSSRDSGVVNNILDTTSWTEEDRPLFRVSKIYPGDKDKRIWFQGPSSTSAWIQILKLLNEKRAEVGMNRGATTVSGPNMFGLDNANIRSMIECQESSLTCATYVHAALREVKTSKKRGPQKNPAAKKIKSVKKKAKTKKTTSSSSSSSSSGGGGGGRRTKGKSAELINIGDGDFKVDENGALLELPAGWSKQIKMREQGATAGQRDTYFLDPNGKRYRSVVEVERALGLRAPKGSTEAGSASRGRKRARDVSPHPMDHMNKPKTKMTTSVVPFKRYKKQMNIEEPITPDDIFGAIFELNDHFKKARKYEKNGDTREKISKYEERYTDKVHEILTVVLLNVTDKDLEESLIWDQLEKYSKKGTKAIKKSTKKLITGLKDNARIYESKVDEAKRAHKESGGKGMSSAAMVAATGSISRSRRPQKYAPLPSERNEEEYIAKKETLKTQRLRLDDVLGWKITYTYGHHCLWLVTPEAMYIIQSKQISLSGETVLSPSPIYASTFTSMRRKLQACSNIVHLLQTWVATDVRINSITMKMIVNAMVNGDEVCATAVKEEEDNQEEEEDLDVVMLEANEAASAQKEILKKTTDYLLRHPIFLSEQLKRHDLQDYRRWLRYGGVRRMDDQQEATDERNKAQEATQTSTSSSTSSSSTSSSSSTTTIVKQEPASGNVDKKESVQSSTSNKMFVPRFLAVSDVQFHTQLEHAGARRVATLMRQRQKKEDQIERAKNRHLIVEENRRRKIREAEELRLQNIRFIDLKLLEEVRKQQSTPNATCDQVVVDLVKSMTTFPIPLPSLVDIDPDLLETLMQINFFAETWPTKMRRRRDVWSCIQEGLGSSKHSSNRQNNRLISLQKDVLKLAVNEANRAWNGNKSKPLPLRCETAMCMFRDDVNDPTMEGETEEMEMVMSSKDSCSIVWPEILRRCLRNSWSEKCTTGSSSTIRHLLDPVRQDGVTLCYSILLELTQDNAGYLFSQPVNKDTLLGEWGSRYASLVSEPMDLSRVQDHLLRLKTYDTEDVGTGGDFFEVPKGCFEFARHVRLVFNNCIVFWEAMLLEEGERQKVLDEREEDAKAQAEIALKAQGDTMYKPTQAEQRAEAKQKAINANMLPEGSLFLSYGEEGLKNTVSSARRLLSEFNAKFDRRVVQALQIRHEMSSSTYSTSSTSTSTSSSSSSSLSSATTTSTVPSTFNIPASVNQSVHGSVMEAWSLHNSPRQDTLMDEATQEVLLQHLWNKDPVLSPLHDDHMSMTLRWTINELMGSDWFRANLKERRQVELNMYRERQEMIRNLKQYESDLKQHEASIKAMGEERAKAQAAEDSKIAARLALGQRVSSRDRTATDSGMKRSDASIAVKNYEGPTTKEEVDETLDMKREINRERIEPLGTDRYGNKYWASPSQQVTEDEPVLLLVEHCKSGRLHSYVEEKEVQQLITSLLAQGTSERILMDNLKKRYKNIVNGLQKVKQIVSNHSNTEQAVVTEDATSTARDFLVNVKSALIRIVADICKTKRVAFRDNRSELEASLNDATQMEPSAALEVFKVQIMKIMRLADANTLIPFRTPLERRKWIDALECSTTFGQIVFYVHRLNYYQKRRDEVAAE